MANQTPPVRTCVVRVGIKCCKGCQTNAKRKLLSVSGVSAVEYNAEQGLLKVSGDVNPTMLLHKLTKWGKKAELVSDTVDISAPLPRTPEHNQQKPTKCLFLRCFGKRSSKAKVEPLEHYRRTAAENGNATPFINASPPPPPPPMVYPPPQAIPYPPPYFGPNQPQPYTSGMFRSVPPLSPPYFPLRQMQFPQMVNSRLHYPHH